MLIGLRKTKGKNRLSLTVPLMKDTIGKLLTKKSYLLVNGHQYKISHQYSHREIPDTEEWPCSVIGADGKKYVLVDLKRGLKVLPQGDETMKFLTKKARSIANDPQYNDKTEIQQAWRTFCEQMAIFEDDPQVVLNIMETIIGDDAIAAHRETEKKVNDLTEKVNNGFEAMQGMLKDTIGGLASHYKVTQEHTRQTEERTCQIDGIVSTLARHDDVLVDHSKQHKRARFELDNHGTQLKEQREQLDAHSTQHKRARCELDDHGTQLKEQHKTQQRARRELDDHGTQLKEQRETLEGVQAEIETMRRTLFNIVAGDKVSPEASPLDLTAPVAPFRVDPGQQKGLVTHSVNEKAAKREKKKAEMQDSRAFKNYTRGFSEHSNAIRKGFISEETEKKLTSLCNALDKLPDYHGTVYRGASYSDDYIKLFQKGGVFTDPAPMSTSKKELTDTNLNAFMILNCWFTIKSLHGKDIAKKGSRPEEAEVLFKPNTRFRITKYDFCPNMKKHMISMEELDV